VTVTTVIKQLIGQQIRKDLVLRPRWKPENINISSHDQTQELVIGGGTGDVSYAIVSTSVDYVSPF
jgi:hypothetical protein